LWKGLRFECKIRFEICLSLLSSNFVQKPTLKIPSYMHLICFWILLWNIWHLCAWPTSYLLYRCAYYMSLPKEHTHTQTRLTTLCPGLPGWAGTRKVKPIWILLEQETVSGSGIHWSICKSAPRSRQITTPAPHHSVFYTPDALPAAQPTASKHWRKCLKKCDRFTERGQQIISHDKSVLVAVKCRWASRLVSRRQWLCCV